MPARTKVSLLKEMSGAQQATRVQYHADIGNKIVTLLPIIPTWMINKWAVEEWFRLGPVLLRAGLLTEGNLVTFAQLCATHGQIATDYANGEQPNASLIGKYLSFVQEFGLTPSSSARVRAPDPAGSSGNRFSSNGKPPPGVK